MSKLTDVLRDVNQGDLFPNRSTVGREYEVVLIGRFESRTNDKEMTTQGTNLGYAGMPAGVGADEGRPSAHVDRRDENRDNRGMGLEPNKGAEQRPASRVVMTIADPASCSADLKGGKR